MYRFILCSVIYLVMSFDDAYPRGCWQSAHHKGNSTQPTSLVTMRKSSCLKEGLLLRQLQQMLKPRRYYLVVLAKSQKVIKFDVDPYVLALYIF